MKRSAILFILLFCVSYSNAQGNSRKYNLMEILGNQKLKFYLDDNLVITQKECSKLCILSSFEDNAFEFKDSVKIYYSNDKLYLEGFYSRGRKNGLFTWYYENGLIECEGNYRNNLRDGEWNYYNKEGKLKKTITYQKNKAKLKDFYNENGIQLVMNGNGVYIDDLLLSPTTSTLIRIKGEIADGVKNGKWQNFTNGKLTGTEFFENGNFIKGISHSTVLGDSEYSHIYYSTFEGYNLFENMNFSNSRYQHCNWTGGGTVAPEGIYYNIIKEEYQKSNLGLINEWFLVKIIYDKTGKITSNDIYSYADDNKKEAFKNFIATALKNGRKADKNNVSFFPVMIKEGRIYFPHDGITELLK